MNVVLKIVALVLMTYSTFLLAGYFSSGHLPVFLVFIGGFCFFFGEYATGSGFVRDRYINASSPEFAWKVLGIFIWLIAFVTFFYL